MHFSYFVIISPWKRMGPFIWRNLNPLHPRMHCAKIGWNWLSGSRAEDFLISSMYFCYFVYISSSFEQTWIPFTQGCFVLTLVEIGLVVLEKRFLNLVDVFLLFHNYLPFKKGMVFHLNKLEFPSPRDTLCQVWLKLALWFWRRRWKCEKFTDGRTDDAHLSFQLRWAKNGSYGLNGNHQTENQSIKDDYLLNRIKS